MTAYVDLDVLGALGEALGDAELLEQTVALYLAELPQRRAAVTRSAEAGDQDGVGFAAHTLGSASLLLGGTELGRVCRGMEADARHAAGVPGPDRLGVFEEACDRTREGLEDWLAAQGSNR